MKKYLFVFIFSIVAQCLAAQANKSQDDSMIRASRSKINEFIASHDVRGMARYWFGDYVRITGNSSMLIGKDSAAAFWTRTFKFQPTIYYVSTPAEIIISEDSLSAWENGTWTGMNTKSKGGNYAANWRKQDDIWKIQSEMYVTLSHY
jgi:ketosteroid isomerase-like protein